MYSRRPTLPKILRVGMMVLALGVTVPLPGQEPSPAASDWAVGSSPARLTVGVDKGSPPGAMSWTELSVPVPRWLGMNIRVFNDSGAGVSSKLLTAAPGEPAILLFDSSSNAQHYDVYFACSDWPPLPLKDSSEGVLLETRAGTGETINRLPDMLDAWNKAPSTGNFAIVPGIFEGGNRFGPEANVLLHFTGWFNAPGKEHLEFATASTDASFVLVDGKEVAEWPGKHDIGGGVHAEHNGAVDVTQGLHQVDYYNAYTSPKQQPLRACLAVKGRSLDNWTMLMPGNTFFTPTAHAHVTDYAIQGTNVPALAISWKPKAQILVGPDVTGIGFITLSLTCHPPQDGTVTWTFDDGTTAEGESVDHLFPRPGMRTVQVEVKDPTSAVAPVRQLVHVQPDWEMVDQVSPDLTPEAQADIMARDPATFSGFDLAGCAAVFTTFKTTDALLKLQPATSAKIKDIADADLPYINEAAHFLAPDLTNAQASEALLRALVDRCAAPSLVTVESSARVALAQLTLVTTTHTDEVKSLLAGVDVSSLMGPDRRAYETCQADLALATGDVASARKQYEALKGNPGGPDARSSVRETGEIGQSRSYLNRKDDESAEDSLNEVANQEPVQKLSPDWQLTRLRLYEDENLPDIAYIYATRLLAVMSGPERSELLYRLTDMAEQRGDHALAGKTLTELLQKDAYSEEAAKAKAKWPGGV
jgi:hypothetical protein